MLHTSWTGRDGAPQDINALAQTSDGMLWIGSTGGLFTFDGITFSPFRPEPGSPPLPFSPVASLLVSKDGDLWVEGVYEGAVARISHNRVTSYDQLEDERAPRLSNLQQSPDGSMWAIVKDAQLIRLGSDKIWHYMPNPKPAPGLITGLFFDSMGMQWVVQDKQLYRSPVGQSRFIATDVATTAQVAFREDGHRGFWMFGEHHNSDIQLKGATRIDLPLSPERRPLPLSLNILPINDVLGTPDGYLWLAIPGKGIVRAKLEELIGTASRSAKQSWEVYSVSDGLSSKHPTALYQDTGGNMWVGGARGLDRFTPPRLVPAIGGAEEGAWSTCTNTLGEIWIASDKGDLWLSKDENTKYIHKAQAIYKLYCGRKGDVWFIDKSGLMHWYGGHLSRMPPLPRPRSEVTMIWEFVALLETGDHDLVASEQGAYNGSLWLFHSGRWSRTFPGAETHLITAMVSSGDAFFFGGVDGTVTRWKQNSLRTLVTKPSPIGVIATLSRSSKNVFALGTGGIAVLRDDYFQMLSFAHPELAHTVSGLVEATNGDVWINGSRGIVRIPGSEMTAALRDSTHKIAAEEVTEGDVVGPATWWKPNPSAIMDIHGRLWFSTLNGVVSLDPEHAPSPPRLPQLSIRSISADGRPLESANSFPPKHQTISIRYFGVNLTDPAKVTYRYLLEGQDETWQNVGNRTEAIYTQLKPGQYTFHVMASNGDDKWTPTISSIQFRVRPHFYQAWWFVSLTILFVLLLGCLAIKIRLSLACRTITMRAEDRADERVQIARELHDTLLQGVQGLLLTFHVAAQRAQADEASRQLMDRALTTADRLIIEGRNRVTSLRSEHLADGELIPALQGVVSDLSSDTPMKCSIIRTGTDEILDFHVVDELFYIAREALTNAFRHSGARDIALELNYRKRSFSMACRDDGKGFQAQAVPTISADGHWGLRGMFERAERVGGRITWNSSSNQGTTVQITIPGFRAYRRKPGLSGYLARFFG